ncbi:hypothetical protein ACQP2F_29415 [Actinoplanes sp. CA-030573]|uniref:hypothetical protein n=1 Tax=Actinoplanes sp. CA-030573 TaxID=3239898 RepID=UPI003D89BEDA
MEKNEKPSESTPRGITPNLAEVLRRASEAGLEARFEKQTRDLAAGLFHAESVTVAFKSGRTTRELRVIEDDASELLENSFEEWQFFEGLDAIYNPREQLILAKLDVIASSEDGGLSQFFVSEDEQPPVPADSGEEEPEHAREMRSSLSWMTPLAGGPIELNTTSAAISTAILPSPRFLLMMTRQSALMWDFLDRSIALRIVGDAEGIGTNARELLDDYSTSLAIDLDMIYGVCIQLQQAPIEPASSATTGYDARMAERPRGPRLKYSHDAASLYTYGRSAEGMPLIAFLAYYQVAEFYFPAYSRADLVRRVRQEVMDPRFDPVKDEAIGRILRLASASGKFASEREQLRSTIAHCLDDDSIRDFICRITEREQFMTGKQRLKGVRPINFQDLGQRLSDQLADRLYQIRCRIVHSKDDGAPGRADMLLPRGPESKLLGHDIATMRYVAQKVLVAGAAKATWVR